MHNQIPLAFSQKPNGLEIWATIDRVKSNVLQLEVGDRLFTSASKWVLVTDITYVPAATRVYNFRKVSHPNNFFAGGILVHNCAAKKVDLVLAHNDKPVQMAPVLVHNGVKSSLVPAPAQKDNAILVHNFLQK